MIMNMIMRYLLFIIVILILPTVSLSQGKSCEFPDPIPYCLFPKPLRLSKLAGRVSDKDNVGIPQSCVTLFDKEHKPVVSANTDENGKFELSSIPTGHYVLIVSYIGFTPAIREIIFDRSRGGSKKINAHMVFSGVDTCSDIDFEKKGAR